MLAVEQGRAASPNRAYRFSAYILRRSEVSDVIGGGRPCCLEATFSREVATKKSSTILAPASNFAPIFETEFCTG
jgi:hypothetical protein